VLSTLQSVGCTDAFVFLQGYVLAQAAGPTEWGALLQALTGQLASNAQYHADVLRAGDLPRSRALNSCEQYDSMGRGPGQPGYR
jgi:hypothetical protein